MIFETGVIIDYGDLRFSKIHELDKLAYARYYDKYFENDENGRTLTFNKWYGTELHKKFITTLLRKHKLEQIKKANH